MRPRWHDSGFDQLDVALVVVSDEQRIAYANPAAQRLFGAGSSALEGQALERFVVPERRGELRNVEDVLHGGSARRVRSVLRRSDGARLDVSITVEPLFDDLGCVEAVSIRYEPIAAGRMSSMPSVRMSLNPGPRGSLTSGLSRGVQSEQRLLPVSSGTQEQRLERVARDLEWLEERLSQPASVAPLDDPRERARVMLVVSEMRGHVREVLEASKAETVSAAAVPAPPKVPKL